MVENVQKRQYRPGRKRWCWHYWDTIHKTGLTEYVECVTEYQECVKCGARVIRQGYGSFQPMQIDFLETGRSTEWITKPVWPKTEQADNPILGKPLIKCLCDAGIIPGNCKRIVIDANYDGVVNVTYECFGSEKLLSDAWVKWREPERKQDGCKSSTGKSE